MAYVFDMADTTESIQEKRQSEVLASGTEPSFLDNEVVVVDDDGTTVNASGWKDQLDRQYGLLSLCGIALTVDNAWVALGSSISVSIGKKTALSSHEGGADICSDSKRRTPWTYIQPCSRRGILFLHWS